MLRPSTQIPIQKLRRGDQHYPTRLNDLFDPPDVLYINGDPRTLSRPMIAIIGSRNASQEGLQNAAFFSRALSNAGATIVSGLAKGIDGAAHWAALKLGPQYLTIAVCGTGVDVVYPKQHWGLAQSIQHQGALISELLPGTGPEAIHFPRRNRIIAALSLGVVVIEAAEKSGSLITARLAADLGREVFALPGPINNPLYDGCHQLIQQGAKLVRQPKDILDELIFPKTCI